MALQGNGFFVVQQGGVQSLTRAGNFQLDAVGNLTTVDGEQVMGYPATGGVVNANAGLVPLTVPVGVNEAAQATQNFSVTANLDASAATGTAFTTPVTMYDSLGQSHSRYDFVHQNRSEYLGLFRDAACGRCNGNTDKQYGDVDL